MTRLKPARTSLDAPCAEANGFDRELEEQARAGYHQAQTLLAATVCRADAPFPFVCRGCGQRCCLDQDIVITPVEAVRMAWCLRRKGTQIDKWLSLGVGGQTGLPVGMLRFRDTGPRQPRVCPFLVSEALQSNGRKPTGRTLCAVHAARPAACRVYPLGRVLTYAPGASRPTTVEYRLLAEVREHCPGLRPLGDEPLPPGNVYRPDWTTEEWVSAQFPADVEDEKNFYVHNVVSRLMDAGLCVPIERGNPRGRLDEREAVLVLGTMLYSPPPAPGDPARDHEAIMRWLQRMLQLPQVFAAYAAAIQRGGIEFWAG